MFVIFVIVPIHVYYCICFHFSISCNDKTSVIYYIMALLTCVISCLLFISLGHFMQPLQVSFKGGGVPNARFHK